MNYVAINASSSGDNTIVSGVTGKKIRVLNYLVMCGNDVTVTFKSGSNSISGPLALAANGGVMAAAGTESGAGQVGLIQSTNQGEALILNLSAAFAVGGHLVYILVD